MTTHAPIPAGEHVPTADQRVVTYAVPWSHYEAQLALRGEKAVPRIAYLEGALELMTPSRDHERVKSLLGLLVAEYALARGIDFTSYGAWTLKSAATQSGVEPDECFVVGSDQQRDVPDLAIEVVWTSGGLDTLDIYRRLGVREVWIWKDGRIAVHALQKDAFERVDRSRLFPDLDLDLLCSLLDQPTSSAAVKALREALRAR